MLTGCVRADPVILVQTRFVQPDTNGSVKNSAPSPTSVVPGVTATVTQEPQLPMPTPVTVRMYLPPAVRASPKEAALAMWLNTQPNLQVDVVMPQSEGEALDAFATGQADVAWLATPAYLLANQRYGAEARWRGLRQGMSEYRGQWLAQADEVRQERDLAPLRSLGDLTGALVGYTDPHSTTGYLFPRALLHQAGVQPASEILLGGDAQAVLAVYRGEVDAAATFWALPQNDYTPGDARGLIADVYGDVFVQVKVLYLSDPIPNDPIVYRRDLAEALAEPLTLAFVELGRSSEGRALLQSLYGLSGLVPTQDSDYDGVRAVVESLDLDLEALLAPTVLP